MPREQDVGGYIEVSGYMDNVDPTDNMIHISGRLIASDADLDLVKECGASCVWCCDSNMFMFNKTTNIKMLLDKKINVCIKR